MKERLSFTFDKKTLKIIEELLKSGQYRNRSHLVEMAVRKMAERGAKA